MKTIHAKNALSLAVITALCAVFARDYLPSVLTGGMVQVVNLYFLEHATGWLMGPNDPASSLVVKILLGLRFFLLLGICAAMLLLLPLDPIAFAVGFSSVVVASLWHGVSAIRAEART